MEDKAPLQAQAEDPLALDSRLVASTAETAEISDTPQSGVLTNDSGITGVTVVDAHLPTLVCAVSWSSEKTYGDILTRWDPANAVTAPQTGGNFGPVPLPHALVLSNQTLPVTTDGNTKITPSVFGSEFARHALYRSDYEVTFAINGTQFHGGSLLCVAVPRPHVLFASLTGSNPIDPKNWTFLDLQNFSQLGLFPSGRLLPRSNSSLVLRLPHPGPSENLSTTAMDITWALVVLVETPLTFTAATAAPALTVTLTVTPQRTQFIGPRNFQPAISRLGNFQDRTPAVTPAMVSYEGRTNVNPGESAFYNLTRQAIGSTQSVNSRQTNFLPPPVTSWRSLLSVPTISTLFEFTTGLATGNVLLAMPVSPTARPVFQTTKPGSGKTVNTNTFLESFSRYFSQWRGSINFTVEHSAPAVASGRLVMGYVPGGIFGYRSGQATQFVTSSFLSNLMQCPHIVWDIAASTTATFTTPYIGEGTWSNITTTQGNQSVTTNTSDGVFIIAVLNGLIIPQVVAQKVDMILHVSAGPDFDLRFPVPVPIQETPYYNGVLDQGPQEPTDLEGAMNVLDLDPMNLSDFFFQMRLYKDGIVGNTTNYNTIVEVPLSLISFLPGTPNQIQNVKQKPFLVFTDLFTLIRGDLAIQVTTEYQGIWSVTYVAPTQTPANQPVLQSDTLANGPFTVVSTRSNNVGVQLRVPFSGINPVFATSNSRTNRGEVLYNPTTGQFNPGDLGTLYIAFRGNIDTPKQFRVYLGLENSSFFLPRPFGPKQSVNNPVTLTDVHMESDDELEIDGCSPEYREFVHKATLESNQKPTYASYDWYRAQEQQLEQEIDQLCEDYSPEEVFAAMMYLTFGHKEWKNLGWAGWCVLNLVEQGFGDDQIQAAMDTLFFDQNDPERFDKCWLLSRLPLELPDGPDFDGVWVDGEWYPKQKASYQAGWDTTFIYRQDRNVYTHWGIGHIGPDGKIESISLVQEGLAAKVDYTHDCERPGTFSVWKPVSSTIWMHATALAGQYWGEYNAHRNCTTFVELLTGEKLTNTGTWLVAGLAVVAAALTYSVAALESDQKPQPSLVDLLKLSHKEKRWLRKQTTPRAQRRIWTPRRCMFFWRRKPKYAAYSAFENETADCWTASYEAPGISVNLTNTTVERAATVATSEIAIAAANLNKYAPVVAEAVENAAKEVTETSTGIKTLTESLQKVVDNIHTYIEPAAKGIARTIGSVLLKVVGIVLIIFGNPNPSTIAGVLAILMAEVLQMDKPCQAIFNSARNLTGKIGSLICGLLGIGCPCKAPKIFEHIDDLVEKADETDAAEDEVDTTDQEDKAPFPAKLPPPPIVTFESKDGVDKFNSGVLAAKNVEWILQKLKEFISWLIAEIKGKEKKDPQTFINANADYMNQLYDESVKIGSCQNVDVGLLDKHLDEAKAYSSWALANKQPSISNLMARTITNYETVKRKLVAAENHPRAEPVVVFISGTPGVGKSVMSNVISSAVCRDQGWKTVNSVYTQPPSSDFFDGYTGQQIHIIDDFCQDVEGNDVKTFCQMVSTVRFTPPMASLEEKGVNYCSKLIIATSNLRTPQSNSIRTPEALSRRCHFMVEALLQDDADYSFWGKTDRRLDVKKAFTNVGPAKAHYFKFDTPFFNGKAIKFSVTTRSGGVPMTQVCDAYELVDMILAEMARRDNLYDLVQSALYESGPPLPEPNSDVMVLLCPDEKKCLKTCPKVTFAQGVQVWEHHFPTPEAKLAYLRQWYPPMEGKPPLRACPCSDELCAKVQIGLKTHDFKSKSLREFFMADMGRSNPVDKEPRLFATAVKVPCVDTTVQKIEKIERNQKWALILTALGVFGSAIGVLGWLISRRKTEEAPAEAPYSGQPKQKKAVKRVYPVKQVHVSYESGLPQIHNKVEANCFEIRFIGFKGCELTALGIRDNIFVTNAHAIEQVEQVEIFGVLMNVEELNPVKIVRPTGPTDLVICTLPEKKFPNKFKDLTRFIPTHQESFPTSDAILMSRTKVLPLTLSCTNLKFHQDVDTGGDMHASVISYSTTTAAGLCGSPLVLTSRHHERIVGIHFAGDGRRGFAVPLYREDFSVKVQGILSEEPFVQCLLDRGELPPSHIPRKSALKKSPAFGAFPQHSEPAILSQKDPRLLDDVILDEKIFEKHVMRRPDGTYDIKTDQQARFVRVNDSGWRNLEAGMDWTVAKIAQELELQPGQFRLLTVEEAINGYGCMDGIDMNQSPGYPHSARGVSRKSLFEWDGDKWLPKPKTLEMINYFLHNPDDGQYQTFLKDELRPSAKARAGKTRVVDGDRVERIIAMRMIFGQFFELMIRKHGPGVMSAVGCNPDVFWTVLFHEMGPSRYNYCYDLDYSCFDASQPAAVFFHLAKYLQPYFSHDIGDALIFGLAYSTHIFGKKAFSMAGGMPSGCVGTSIFNSINNSAFIASALIEIGVNPDSCSWICYGDDVIIATDEENLPVRIAEFFHSETSLTVTPASKAGTFPETSTIFDVTFLKRAFQRDSRNPALIHPKMDMGALKQSVQWMTDGPFQQKVMSLLQLAFHSGREDFEDFVDAVKVQSAKKGVFLNLPGFEYFMALWYVQFRR